MSFYTSTFVRAGQELCWDYGYEVRILEEINLVKPENFCLQVGSIADKEIFCSCGADNCRGRLL